MNRRGFLAGVMGICAGLPVVGRFVPKLTPKIVSSGPVTYTLPTPQATSPQFVFVMTTEWSPKDGTLTWCICDEEIVIKPAETKTLTLISTVIEKKQTAGTDTDGVTMEWFR